MRTSGIAFTGRVTPAASEELLSDASSSTALDCLRSSSTVDFSTNRHSSTSTDITSAHPSSDAACDDRVTSTDTIPALASSDDFHIEARTPHPSTDDQDTIDPAELPRQPLDPFIAKTLTPTEPGQLYENARLQEYIFTPIPPPEKPEIPRPALQVLSQACKQLKHEEVRDLMTELCFSMVQRTKKLKFEPPILRSDHETDCRELARKVKAFRKPQVEDHRLPLHPTESEKGEGLEFPDADKKRAKEWEESAGRETLEVTREAVTCLAGAIKGFKAEWTDEDQRLFIQGLPTYTGRQSSVTPPLSPVAIGEGEEEEELLLPWELADLQHEEDDGGDVLEEDISAQEQVDASPSPYFDDNDDGIDLSRIGGNAQLPSPYLPLVELPSIEPAEPFGALDETSLVCLVDANNTEVRWEEFVVEDEIATDIPASDETLPSSRIFENTLRLPVPVVSGLEPDWAKCRANSAGMFEWVQENTNVAWQGPKWSNNKEVEQKMWWLPLTQRLQKIHVDETIEVESGVSNYLESVLKRTEDSEVPDNGDYIQRTTDLAILNAWNGEEDMIAVDGEVLTANPPPQPQAAQPPPEHAMPFLKKRKLHDIYAWQSTVVQGPQNQSNSMESEYLPSTDILTDLMQDITETSLQADHSMEMRSPKRLKLTLPKAPPRSMFPGAGSIDEEAARSMPPPPRPVPAIAPTFNPPASLRKLIVSAAMSGSVIDHLEKLLPESQHIRRDYDAYNTATWSSGSVGRTVVRSPLADEADITVSPATGILLTSMIKLRQKPLPGTISASDFRTMVEKVAARYERLIIIASEGRRGSEMMNMLSPSDAMVLAEFQGFAAGLESDVQVFYAGGGDETLAKWAAWAICRHAQEGLLVENLLLENETYWELFLRHAGLNVYAAQVILGMLKDPSEGARQAVVEPRHGLPQFLSMTSDERVAMFGSLLGGRRVLDRVSQVLDAPFTPFTREARAAGPAPNRGGESRSVRSRAGGVGGRESVADLQRRVSLWTQRT
ncbi:hypothetical protein QBC46DRAFT_318066 [Diplogelasinospora grovesii]|uniref:Uncharacterized protein n=1 Tax=Diplogelasinospora grovesii TaxID=303347 RepID=A0AAN6N6C9_9PEZI|nr:hypothetical protein QBC46DRAFT_318066 [Diplogelasinospora grovesii]